MYFYLNRRYNYYLNKRGYNAFFLILRTKDHGLDDKLTVEGIRGRATQAQRGVRTLEEVMCTAAWALALAIRFGCRRATDDHVLVTLLVFVFIL